MHYYQFNISDWALHTSHLTLEEEGVYRRILDHYYDTEKPIPKETQPVIRRLRLVNHSVPFGLILAEFFHLEDDGWHNHRADIEIKEYLRKGDVARANGKRGGRPKKKPVTTGANNPEETQSVNLANPDVTQKEPDHKLTKNYELGTINQELETSNQLKDLSAKADTPKKPAKRFVVPAPQTVSDYMFSKAPDNLAHANSEAHKFVDYYSSKGWVVGKSPMKDWKAAARNWMKNNFSSAQPVQAASQREAEIDDWINQPSGGLFAPADQNFIEGEVLPRG